MLKSYCLDGRKTSYKLSGNSMILVKPSETIFFNTETWLIPTESPYMKVMGKALQFVSDYQSEDTLLIVYYGGHAKINEARQSTWSW